MKTLIIYVSVSGLICALRAFYLIKTGDEDIKKILEHPDLKNHINENLLCLVYLIFGWLLLPITFIKKIYKLFTGKNLF